MKSEDVTSPNLTDPLAEVNDFESASEREQRIVVTQGGDVAHFLCEFLKGNRYSDISLAEITMTQLYKQLNSAEKNALRVATADVSTLAMPSAENKKIVRERDGYLMAFASGHKVTGSWREQSENIPAVLKSRDAFDAATFPRQKQYKRPEGLFAWIWSQR